jgi:hypothetical protein
MASIKTLFDKITIIRPEKVGLLGIEGLEQELIANVRLLAEEIWDSLPLKKEYSMPIIDDNALPILENYSSEDLLQTHLSSINESIKIVSTLLQEIQKRTKAPETNLKKRTKMPSSFNDCQINTSTGVFLTNYSGLTGNSNLEDGCDAMGIPCSIDNLLNYGEMLFSTYKNAAVMIEDFVTRTASMFSAAAERNSAPIFVESVISSKTAILRAFLHNSSTLGREGRIIAQRAPRVSSNPVREVKSSLDAV